MKVRNRNTNDQVHGILATARRGQQYLTHYTAIHIIMNDKTKPLCSEYFISCVTVFKLDHTQYVQVVHKATLNCRLYI